MDVLILTLGTRGDIQPFVALARGLDASGHNAVLAGPVASIPIAEPYGIRVIPIDGIIQALRAELVRDNDTTLSEPRTSFVKRKQLLRSKYRQLRQIFLEDIASASDCPADIVVYNPVIPGFMIAEHLGVPAVPASPNACWIPTKSFLDPQFPFTLPRGLNQASFQLTNLHMTARRSINLSRWREQTLGLSRWHGQRNFLRRTDGKPSTVLHAMSRHALPTPLQYSNSVHTTGFWLLPAPSEWRPSQKLCDFLDAGDPPIFVGFGSAGSHDQIRTMNIVADAVRLARVRAIFVGNRSAINTNGFDKDVLHLDEAPFDWLMPRMSAIIHQCGTGTTGSALASGRPQVVCPLPVSGQWGRQLRFHAWQMYIKGVSPAPLLGSDLTREKLCFNIRHAMTDDNLASQAERVGYDVQAEDGVTHAIKVIESEMAAP